MFARLIFSLGVVIGLMWVAANVLRKRGFAPVAARATARGVQVELLARKPLGRNASIAVVRVGERSMVVGVTEHQITKLDDADLDEIESGRGGTTGRCRRGRTSPGSAWKTMLDQMRNRTVRR